MGSFLILNKVYYSHVVHYSAKSSALLYVAFKSFVFLQQVTPVFVVHMVTGIKASIAIFQTEIGKSNFCFLSTRKTQKVLQFFALRCTN